MATRQGHEDVRWRQPRALALAVAVSAAFASAANAAGTEIALRFHDDNPAAQGRSLSSTAQAAIEKTAGVALIAARTRCRRCIPVWIRTRTGAGHGAQRAQQAARHRRSRLRRRCLRRPQRAPSNYAPVRDDPVTSLLVRMKPAATLKSANSADAKSRFAAKAGVAVTDTRALADGSAAHRSRQSRFRRAPLRRHCNDSPPTRDVAHVEVDRRARTQAQPSDPMFGSQWNLSDPVGGIAAPRAWDITTGDANAPIAILDTGVLPHPDLAGRVIGGYDFVADARFSNDGDGRDPDAVGPG